MYRGRAAFGATEDVVFGHPAADAAVVPIDRFGAARTFPIVSTLSRGTCKINATRKMTPGIPRKVERPAPKCQILPLSAS